MNYDKCYFDDDLRVYYFNKNENINTNGETGKSRYESYYRIIWMTGESSVYMGKKNYRYSEPIICIASPNKPLEWLQRTIPNEFIIIEIHPKLFSDLAANDKVLDFFYKLHDDQNVFCLNSPQNNYLNTCIDLIKSALFAKCGRFHIEARVKTLISELCMIYESKYSEYVASTDSIPAQILDFINKNYTTNITLDVISDKFFVSKPTILAVIKRMTGFAFKEYITKLRLDTAVKMLKNGDQSAQKIACLCGFNEYSAFYKAFKKKYGYSPKQLINEKHDSFPLK